ncbi:hypothetical protein [Mycolicibacterium thermoresistibile]
MLTFFGRAVTSPQRIGSSIFAAAAVTVGLAACSTPEPALPANTEASTVHEFLTSTDADAALGRISTYDWPDDGAKPAGYFTWIGPDATSDNPRVATRAGEAAYVLAEFLAGNESALSSIAPELIDAYATALTPFQAAMVGYDDGVRGFGALGGPDDLSAARSVFAVIATDPDTGRQFIDSAYTRAAEIAATAAEQGCQDRAVAADVGPPAVRAAAELSGVAASADHQLSDRPPPLWDVAHAMARACVAVTKEPPQGAIIDYIENGELLPPDVVRQRDTTLEIYYQTQRDYVSNQGLSLSEFYDWWKEALGR